MKIGYILVILAVIAMAMNISAQSPGLYTAINAGGVTRLVNKVLPPLFDSVRGMGFPDCNDGHHRISNIHIPEIGLENLDMSIDDSGVIALRVNRFHCDIALRYKYKRKLFSVSANVRVRLGDAYFHINMGLTNHEGRFALHIAHVAVDAGEASVKISGGLIAKFLNAVKSLFKSRIKKTILDQIRTVLSNGLAAFAEQFVTRIPLRFDIGTWGSLDMSLFGPILYQGNTLVVGFSGDIQSKAGEASGAPRHDISFAPSGGLFDVMANTFLFNSAFHTFFKGGLFNHQCTKAAPNGYNAVTLDTTSWGKEGLPAIQTKYPNKDLTIKLSFGAPPAINSNGGQLKFNADLSIAVFAGDIQAFKIKSALSAAATAVIDNRHLFPQITDLSAELSLVETAIGDFSLAIKVIEGLINFANGVAATVINEQLLQGIPLPMTDNLVLIDPKLHLPENAVGFACDVDFNV